MLKLLDALDIGVEVMDGAILDAAHADDGPSVEALPEEYYKR